MTNKPATEYLRSIFLTSFNLFDLLFGDYVNSDLHYTCFKEYASACGIKDEAWLRDTYAAITHELIQGAVYENEHNMVLSGFHFYPDRCDGSVRLVAEHRSSAYKIKKEFFEEDSLGTLDDCILRLMRATTCGSADCIALAAFLMDRGHILKRDSERAEQMLCDLMLWNHPLGLLLGTENEDLCDASSAKLRTLLHSCCLDGSWEYIRDSKALSDDYPEDSVALALERRFALGHSKRERVEWEVLSLMRCAAIDSNTVCRLLKRGRDETQWDSLPLDITDTDPLEIPEDILGDARYISEDDRRVISRSLRISYASGSARRPLLITCSDSDVIKEIGAGLVAALSDRVGAVDLDGCDDHSFSLSMSNPIIYELNRIGKKNAIILIKNCDRLSEREQEQLCDFLHRVCSAGVTRRDLVSLDLSGIIPVLLSGTPLCRTLTSECYIHRPKPLSEGEKRNMIADILSEKKKRYSLSELVAEESAMSYLCSRSGDEVGTLIDKIMICQPSTEDRLCITLGHIKKHLPAENSFRPNMIWR